MVTTNSPVNTFIYNLNKQLCYIHIDLANTWGNIRQLTENCTNEKMRINLDKKYKNMNL